MLPRWFLNTLPEGANFLYFEDSEDLYDAGIEESLYMLLVRLMDSSADTLLCLAPDHSYFYFFVHPDGGENCRLLYYNTHSLDHRTIQPYIQRCYAFKLKYFCYAGIALDVDILRQHRYIVDFVAINCSELLKINDHLYPPVRITGGTSIRIASDECERMSKFNYIAVVAMANSFETIICKGRCYSVWPEDI